MDYAIENLDYSAIVHTFDTEQHCQVQCKVQCSMHHFNDLMMQRWLCPSKNIDKIHVLERNESVASSFTLFLTVCAVLICLLFLSFAVMIFHQRITRHSLRSDDV